MVHLLPDNIIYGGDLELVETAGARSLGQHMLRHMKEKGDMVVLIDAVTGHEYTANQFRGDVIRFAQILQQLGVQAGDVVGLSSENRIEFATVLFATLIINATAAPFNTTYTKREVHHALNLSKPKVVFASSQAIDLVAEVAKENSFVKYVVTFDETKPTKAQQIYTFKELMNNRQKFPTKPDFESPPTKNLDDDVSLIMCSSGTTGMPKGVQLTQKNILYTLESFHINPLMIPGICLLSVIPWFHAFGCLTLVMSPVIGAKLVFLPRFDDKLFLGAIEKYRVVLAFMVPPLMVFLAKHPLVDKYDLSSILGLLCGAAPLSKETEDQVKARIGVPIIRQGYGLSESTLSLTLQSDDACSPGSVGTLKEGTYCKVIDPETGKILGPNQRGELCFKGPTIMKGYIGDVHATQSTIKDGWLHTGDIGYFTDTLEFFIVDRIKELIKYKGFQVPPAEIEALLLQHPEITDAAVIGREDESAGELPMAFVVKRPNSKLTEQDVAKYVRENASPAKQLRGGVVFLKEIPKNPSGKILRRVLRDMVKKQKSKL